MQTALIPMRYCIVCDMPGYLRVRFGAYAFTKEEGYGIAERLQHILGVVDVTTSTANGSVLVRYDESECTCRRRVLSVLSGFERDELPQALGSDEQRKKEIDVKFMRKLVGMVAAHIARRLLLPAPLRFAYTVWQSFKFIGRGISHLLARELSVEVLDATAIVAAMLRTTFDSAGTIMLLLNISDLLETFTHARSRIALEQSLAINVDCVWLVTEDGEISVPVAQVHKGDKLRVRTGAMITVDGRIVEGEAAINEASMTGEAKLAIKSTGDTVFAGTVIEEGSIVVEVRSAGADTRIHRIVKLVDESEKLKASVQSRAERLADAIVPFSFIAFFSILVLTRNITKAMAVLMVDYSCAIKLSTPVAVMSAMREGISRGIVIKGGRYLEVMAAADTIVFDKTGTLTTATPKVERVICFGEGSENEILRIAACLEEHFPHSMARAVVEGAYQRGVRHDEEAHAEVKYLVAHGIASTIDGKEVVLGSAHYIFEDEGVKAPAGYRQRIADTAPGASVIYLAIDHRLEGAICINDPVRIEAQRSIRALRELGFKHVVMLTGDAENAAKAAASKLGIKDFRSQVLPEDKAAIINELKRAGHTVVMVGDGVNDSPALAVADVSIAMVDASDIAREVADITLLHSSLDELLSLRRLSCDLMCRIERNYRIIVVFNTALIVFGIAGILAPTTSALLHNVSTMLITADNMRPLLPARKQKRRLTE